MNCQYICHFTADKVNRLRKIKQQLEIELRNNSQRINNIKHYNWGPEDKCKYGIQCSKTIQARNDYNRLTNNIDELMTAYIEQNQYDRYHVILNLLRGYFPTVYNQFERDIRTKQ